MVPKENSSILGFAEEFKEMLFKQLTEQETKQ